MQYHQHILTGISLLNKPSLIWILFISLLSALPKSFAQGNAAGTSPIWGNTNRPTLNIGQPLYNTQTWAATPSQQTLDAIPDQRGVERGSQSRAIARFRNSAGNLLLTDSQGNLIYDSNGNPMIDSASLGYQSSGSMSADASTTPPPPPDDPVDVPIDGGVEILLMIGLGVGYQNRKKGKAKLGLLKVSF